MDTLTNEPGDHLEINDLEHTHSENDQKLSTKTENTDQYYNPSYTLTRNEVADSFKSRRKRKSTETLNLYRKKRAKFDSCSAFDCIDQIYRRKDQQRVYESNRYILDENYKQEKISASQQKI